MKDIAKSIDTARKTVTLGGGATIGYDKLVVSPGIDLMFGGIEGLAAAQASGQILQAWKAGPETTALRKQLEAMPDGGVRSPSPRRPTVARPARTSGFARWPGT